MTIGRNSRMGSVRSSIRAPKFLDKSNGFYGRLDEPETTRERDEVEKDREGGVMTSPTLVHSSVVGDKDEVEAFDFTEGMMEDDGETLLSRKPSRRSSRWRRSSRRKQKEGRDDEEEEEDRRSQGQESPADVLVKIQVEMEKLKKMEEDNEKMGRGKEPMVVHFPVREDADDQVLIREKKRGREEEGEEERKMKIEQEEGMKVVKRKNYRKALDRAFRRGWEAFITNLYSVTLTPMTSSSPSSPSFKKKLEHSSALAEFR